MGWNQKSLDYEIETRCGARFQVDVHQVEIKSLSITRLKQAIRVRVVDQAGGWNQKSLDYEIETSRKAAC